MRQRLNPWAVVLTAALTFGSLMAFVGPRSFEHNQWGRHGFHDSHHRYRHGECAGYNADKSTAKPDSNITHY